MSMIGDLWARLALRPDKKSFAAGDKLMAAAKMSADQLQKAVGTVMIKGGISARSKLTDMLRKAGAAADETKDKLKQAGAAGKDAGSGIGRMVAAAGAFFAGAAGKRALIDFNADVEDTKLQIAGMLALTKKTDLVEQLGVADTLFANLQRRAASLPGTTQEYTKMLGMLAQPLTDAGLGLQDLEDLTVNSVVAAKAFGISWEVAARDIDQAMRGQFHSVDQFSSKVLGTMGFKGEDGRSRYNAKTQSERAAIFKQGLMSKQITQLGEAQGKTFRGTLSTLQDAFQQFAGKVGKPLFDQLASSIQSTNKWLDENKERVSAVATTIGGVLVDAFHVLGAALGFVVDVMGFLREHTTIVQVALSAIAAIIAKKLVGSILSMGAAIKKAFLAFGPWGLALTAAAFVVQKMIEDWDGFKEIVGEVGEALRAAFEYVAELPIIKQLIWLVNGLGDLVSRAAGVGDTFQDGFGNLFGVGKQSMTPSAAAAAGSNVTVTVEGINVTAPPGTDPKAYAEAIRPHVREMLDTEMRKAML